MKMAVLGKALIKNINAVSTHKEAIKLACVDNYLCLPWDFDHKEGTFSKLEEDS